MTVNIPATVVKCLLGHFIDKRHLAYCFVGKDKRLISSGGDLAFYGLENLKNGDLVDDALQFMEESMFSDCQSIFIEHVFFTSDSTANIYISTDGQGICVILTDVTPEVRRIEAMQQTGNELNLCRERLRQLELRLRSAQNRP